MATIRAGVMEVVESNKAGEVVKAAVAATAGDVYQNVKEFIPTISTRPELTEAEVVVSGGRGLKGPEGSRSLKNWLTSSVLRSSASRASVDSGWLGHEYQVGQTGRSC